MPLYELQKPKVLKGGRFEDMLLRMLNKVEGSNKRHKSIKEDVSFLSRTITSHSVRSNCEKQIWVISRLT